MHIIMPIRYLIMSILCIYIYYVIYVIILCKFAKNVIKLKVGWRRRFSFIIVRTIFNVHVYDTIHVQIWTTNIF